MDRNVFTLLVSQLINLSNHRLSNSALKLICIKMAVKMIMAVSAAFKIELINY